MKSRAIVSLAIFFAFVLGLLSFHPIARAVETLAVISCNAASSACAGGRNSGAGSGVLGTSAKGNGTVGQTTFPSTSVSNFKAGIVGQDLSAKGVYDLGIWGISTRGDAVLGQSTSGSGVAGSSSSSVGVNGLSKTGYGVYGQDNGGKKTPTGVFGNDIGANLNGAGIAGQSKVGTGVVAVTSSSSASNPGAALVAAAPNGALVFVGVGPGNYAVAELDGSGNLSIAGQLVTSSLCQSGCQRTRHVNAYAASAATPTLEDTGEAQLTGGGAYVRLDPAFANAMDPHQGYYVLITPEGDTHGLYVAQRTPSGFAVRESFGGHSSAAFAYRIVAHPFGVHVARLPFAQSRSMQTEREPALTNTHE